MKHQLSQKGNVLLLFGILIVPILSLALLIGVEIGGILSTIRSIENNLDRIALMVGRHLPNINEASRVADREILSMISRFGLKCDSLVPLIKEFNGGLALQAECFYTPRIVSIVGVKGLQWRFKSNAEVLRAGTDLMLLVDMSAYQAPTVDSLRKSEPPSSYFREKYGDTDEAQLRTQRCNNPITRAIKRFALATYPKFINTSFHRIGVGFYPGSADSLINGNGNSPYLSLIKDLNQSTIFASNYNGMLGSDYECSQAAEYESENPHLYALPIPAMADSSGLGTQVWGKVVSDYNAAITENTWQSLMEGLRYSASGTTQSGDIFGNDRQIDVVYLAGDVPRNNGERYPWKGGISDEDTEEFIRITSSGRNVNLVYLIYAPSQVNSKLPNMAERASEFSKSLKGIEKLSSRSKNGSFKSFVKVYTDEKLLLKEGLDLVRRNVGSIALRRLQ